MKVASRAVAYVCLFSLFFLVTGFSSPEKETRKATWLWHTNLIASEQEEILTFSREQGVNLLYLRIDMTQKPAYYQSFIREARRNGVQVHALAGSPTWGLKDNQNRVLAMVDWVHTYNQRVSADEKFSGVHLDIEPYLLPEWKADPESVIRQWGENAEAYLDLVHQDPALEVGCDIPFWLDKYAMPKLPNTAFSQWLISQHDHVAIMSYRDQAEGPNSISSLVPQELGWADELGKKILLGVETKQSGEGNYVSFYEEGTQYMNQEIDKLSELMANHSSYGGIAVHSYEYWKVLRD
ncbi:hypothetical protein [Brevibacillus choshinensis]|uniref:Amidase n=1 Tax=Brevibacillus choshinensis TaxID=54911 RepID=A0ABX7FI24_BRECH|nr:hypothetical protein [Brevibacillus choshinensis]QRG65866.1 hypothetical protein JNE38_20075 [Brevibacillus choshinensis]